MLDNNENEDKNTIVLTGGTGFLGTELVKSLIEEGYYCIVFTRNPNSEKNFKHTNIKYVEWIKDPDYLKQYIKGVKAVINLAGEPLIGKRWTKGTKDRIINSRVETTKLLVEAINGLKDKPEAFLSSSASGYYGDQGDKKLTEEDGPGSDFLSEVCKKWEAATDGLSKDVRKVIFRTGVVLHPAGGALQKMLIAYKLFVGGPLGKGIQYISWIHIVDWKSFLIFAVQNGDVIGNYNITAPNPVTINVLSKEISKVYKRPNLIRVPEFMIRLILGEASETVLSSQRILPKRIMESKYDIHYPVIRKALESFR